jgi:hypothetical protein
MRINALVDHFMTAEEIATEEAIFERQFQKEHFVPANVDPNAPLPLPGWDVDRIVGPECVGCERVKNDYTCNTYQFPSAWFRHGKHCPMASHIKSPEQVAAEKKRVGQQKQKKSR